MGFTSVKDRFEQDQLFRAQMEEQGWTSNSIEDIEKGAQSYPTRVALAKRSTRPQVVFGDTIQDSMLM